MSTDSSVEQQSVQLYEKEVQEYLASNLNLLGISGLELIQTEYPVKFGRDSGRIDILAKEKNGTYVVIEVKRGVAGRSAVGQLQSYMGTIHEEYPSAKVKGLLVAMGLDDAARSAMLVTQDVQFFEFRTRFEFKEHQITKPTAEPKIVSDKTWCREDYWENLGGTITDEVIKCSNCNEKTKVVKLGSASLCGFCGKKISGITNNPLS